MFLKTDTLHQFDHKQRTAGIKSGIVQLLVHRRLIQLGVGLFGIFTAIYLYERFGRRVSAVILYCIAFYGIGLFLQPLGTKWVTRIGLKIGLAVGVLLLAANYFLYSIDRSLPLPLFIVGTLLCSATYHVIYWIPYHIEFVKLAPRKSVGRILGYFAATSSLMGILMPVFAGWTIQSFGYNRLIFYFDLWTRAVVNSAHLGQDGKRAFQLWIPADLF